jgi:hypothetical protein
VRWIRRLVVISTVPLGAVLGVAALPYVLTPVYRFPVADTFHGRGWYNPYDSAPPHWRRVNLHAHSRVWGGITKGGESPDVVRQHYRALGYDAFALSNYHHRAAIAATDELSVYEHGFNLIKAHYLVIGGDKVNWFDFPFGQTVHQQQYVLDRLRTSGSLVAIAHPHIRNARRLDQLARLTGYELLEIASAFGVSERHWEAALDAGRIVWALGSDDSHRVGDPRQTGIVWTSLATSSLHPDTVRDVLRAGRHVVVRGRNGEEDARLTELSMRHDTLTVRFVGDIEWIRVLTTAGAVVAEVSGREAIIPVPSAAPYVRVVAKSMKTTMYLNPVFRTDSAGIRRITAEFDTVMTWSLRCLLAACLIVLPLLSVRHLYTRPAIHRAMRAVVVALTLGGPIAADAQGPAYGPGERARYDVEYSGIPVGRGEITNLGVDTVRGTLAWRLRLDVRGGIPLFRVHERMESWYEPITQSSQRFVQTLREGSRHTDRRFEFFPERRAFLQEGQPGSEATVASPLDEVSFLWFVRGHPLEVGRSYEWDRYFRPRINPVRLHVLRRDTIDVPAGRFPSLVVQPVFKSGGIFAEGGRAEIWLSDDDRRIVVQMRSRMRIGSINLLLRDYRASGDTGTAFSATASSPRTR